MLPLLLGFSVPATAHNIFNGGEPGGVILSNAQTEEGEEGEEGEGAETEVRKGGGILHIQK